MLAGNRVARHGAPGGRPARRTRDGKPCPAVHRDNAAVEVSLPPWLRAATLLGYDWEAVPWAVPAAMRRAPEWRRLVDAQSLTNGGGDGRPRPVRDEPEARAWMDGMREQDVVLDWVPGTGFRYRARRAGIDTGFVRLRDPEPQPRVRVIDLTTGAGGCLTRGLFGSGRTTQVPPGCQLVTAWVCWRVAFAMPKVPRRDSARPCRRCLTARRLLPGWAIADPRPHGRPRPRRHIALSLGVLPPMASVVDGERPEVAWLPALERHIRGDQTVDVDTRRTSRPSRPSHGRRERRSTRPRSRPR